MTPEKPSKNGNTEITIGIIIIAVTLLGFLLMIPRFGMFRDTQTNTLKNSDPKRNDKTASKEAVSNYKKLVEQNDSSISNRISKGEEILVEENNNSEKGLAVENFSKGNTAKALAAFNNSLKSRPNDPEALIYLNNSIAASDSHPLKIAVSVPIGGNLDVAQEILRGVAQAQEEVNNRGKGGTTYNGNRHFVQVYIANDDNDPEVASQIAAELVGDPEISGVVGHNSSSATLAAAPIYEKGGLVMISPTSVAKDLSSAGSHIFRTTPSTDILSQTLAEYAVENDLNKVAVCVDSTSPASISFSSSFSTAIFQLEGETIDSGCDFSKSNFNPEKALSEAISQGAESLLLIPSVDKITQALEIAKANNHKLPLLGNHSMYSYQTLKLGNSDINGLVLPVSWHPRSQPDLNLAFSNKSKELWGTPATSWRTAAAYDATMSLIKGSGKANREQLHNTLASSNFSVPGVLGEIKFQNSGDRLIKGILVEVRSGKNKDVQFAFEPVVNQVKSEK